MESFFAEPQHKDGASAELSGGSGAASGAEDSRAVSFEVWGKDKVHPNNKPPPHHHRPPAPATPAAPANLTGGSMLAMAHQRLPPPAPRKAPPARADAGGGGLKSFASA